MPKRKICVITGTRAEYGLLAPLMRLIKKERNLMLQLIATGAHLSPEFGLTYREIENDGFKIDKKVEILLSSDTPVGIGKSMGLALIGFSEVFDDIKPDLLVIHGDRYEMLAAASAAMVCNIPIAHISGGEVTIGAMDEAIRHALTKMSHIHFTSTEEYRRRVIQLGEKPETVFNVGSPTIDNIKSMKLMNKTEFVKRLGRKMAPKNLLITFHPATLEKESPERQFKEVLNALDSLEDSLLIFTKPNADTNGRVLIEMIDDYVARHQEKSLSFTSMGQYFYMSALQFVDAVVGNSSSGIVDAPSFKIGTVNIGIRQEGRIKAESVIDCSCEKREIAKAFEKLFSPDFQKELKKVKSPFGEGGACEKTVKALKEFNLDKILHKRFYDVY